MGMKNVHRQASNESGRALQKGHVGATRLRLPIAALTAPAPPARTTALAGV
jgi:hypothetical protein